MTLVGAATYAIGIAFWMSTALYALLTSQGLIAPQFLEPELLPLLAWFSQYWPAVTTATAVLWIVPRGTPSSRPGFFGWVTTILWLGTAAMAWSGRSLATLVPGETALACGLAAVAMLVLLAIAEQPAEGVWVGEARPHTASDFFACLLAAFVLAGVDGAVVAFGREPVDLTSDALHMWLVLRGPLLAGMATFLVLTLVRSVAGAFRRPVVAEAWGTVLALGVLFGWLVDRVVLPSTWIVGGRDATVVAYLSGLVLALVITARAAQRFENPEDGVGSVLGSLAPRLAGHVLGFPLWLVAIVAVVFAVSRLSEHVDWNAVEARLGLVLAGLLALGGARRLVRMPGSGEPAVFLGFAMMGLAAHAGIDRFAGPVAIEAQTPAGHWTEELLVAGAHGPSELYDLLPGQTNIPSAHEVAPVQVDWAALSGPPAADRPHVFVFVVDSLRRDYLSPYNSAVTFTPAFDAFANDSLVFSRAFTQYGASGLSVPSIWMGGPLLHKQYVTPFESMNALSRLVGHERYAEWISMDHILEVILPVTPALVPLDRRVPVRDFRLCRTLDEVRGRLADLPANGRPVFVYSFPQDLSLAEINREGGAAVDDERYEGFHAPVASRVRRFDACFGAFVEDLKTRGLYDRSIVVVTSDHGDSLGEEGRMGHAQSLSPEIARVPLIVHVPPALRDRYSWDLDRPAYTTDITPTLYRLLGHQPVAPEPYFGESLAGLPGVARPAAANRMIAASDGSVYGAVLDGASRLYVADAIRRRERAFRIGDGDRLGWALPVTPAMRRNGGDVIRSTVESLARQYQLSVPPRKDRP